jgi:hypothetical protein
MGKNSSKQYTLEGRREGNKKRKAVKQAKIEARHAAKKGRVKLSRAHSHALSAKHHHYLERVAKQAAAEQKKLEEVGTVALEYNEASNQVQPVEEKASDKVQPVSS